MKKIVMIAVMAFCSMGFAKEKATATATLRAETMEELQMKVDQFVLDLGKQVRLNELLPRECNPTANKRVVRKAYKISYFASAVAQIKVLCTRYRKK